MERSAGGLNEGEFYEKRIDCVVLGYGSPYGLHRGLQKGDRR